MRIMRCDTDVTETVDLLPPFPRVWTRLEPVFRHPLAAPILQSKSVKSMPEPRSETLSFVSLFMSPVYPISKIMKGYTDGFRCLYLVIDVSSLKTTHPHQPTSLLHFSNLHNLSGLALKQSGNVQLPEIGCTSSHLVLSTSIRPPEKPPMVH